MVPIRLFHSFCHRCVTRLRLTLPAVYDAMDYVPSFNFINIKVTLSTLLSLPVVGLFSIVAAEYWICRKWRSSLYSLVVLHFWRPTAPHWLAFLSSDLHQVVTWCPKSHGFPHRTSMEEYTKCIIHFRRGPFVTWFVNWSSGEHSTFRHIIKPNWVYPLSCFVRLAYQHFVKIFWSLLSEARMINHIAKR